MSYETRSELKRRHMAALRELVEESERRGTTLTEVLIALLIMSIGIVALAVIFPISVGHTIKATQLTQATDQRFNAETFVDLHPQVITRPQLYGNVELNLTAPAGDTNDPPLGAFGAVGSFNIYMFDPLGYAQALANTGNQPANINQRIEHWYGQQNGAPANLIPRYPISWRTIPAALSVCASLDSWVLQYEGFGTPGAPVQLQPPPITNPPQPPPGTGVISATIAGLQGVTLNQTQVGAQPFPPVRAVIFSADGAYSQTRNLLQIKGNQIFWSEATNNLDANGNGWIEDFALPQNVFPMGNVRIEQQEARYTWMLSVHRPADKIGIVDVVVYFGRDFKFSDDERMYSTNQFIAGNQVIVVNYPAGQKPFIRKGGFMFDAGNGYWYRIVNFIDTPAALAATVTIEIPAVLGSAAAGGLVMFPRNVVDVYPIGTKSFP